MKIKINRNILLETLQKLSKAAPTRSTIPILNSFLFLTETNSLQIRATDLEITLISTISAEIQETGSIAIPQKTLIEITSALPETEMIIEVEENNNIIIKTKEGNYNISGTSSEEYPNIPQVDNKKEINIKSKKLKELVNKTVFALSKDDTKPSLMGAYMEILKSQISLVATDGHRLAYVKNEDFSSEGYEGSLIIPKKFLNLILTLLDTQKDTTIWVGENHITTTFGNITAFSRLIDAQYPNFRAVIPQNNDKIMIGKKEEILSSVKRVGIFSNRETRQIDFIIDQNKLIIKTEDSENATKAKESLAVNYNQESITIGFNANYLSDILNHIETENIIMRLNTPISATLFSSENNDKNTDKQVMLLMPMRTSTM